MILSVMSATNDRIISHEAMPVIVVAIVQFGALKRHSTVCSPSGKTMPRRM